jgi:hypothetical protein
MPSAHVRMACSHHMISPHALITLFSARVLITHPQNMPSTHVSSYALIAWLCPLSSLHVLITSAHRMSQLHGLKTCPHHICPYHMFSYHGFVPPTTTSSTAVRLVRSSCIAGTCPGRSIHHSSRRDWRTAPMPMVGDCQTCVVEKYGFCKNDIRPTVKLSVVVNIYMCKM